MPRRPLHHQAGNRDASHVPCTGSVRLDLLSADIVRAAGDEHNKSSVIQPGTTVTSLLVDALPPHGADLADS